MKQLIQFRNALRGFKTRKKNFPSSWVEVFTEIAIREGQSLQEIAASTGQTNINISAVVKELESRSLVYKRKDKENYKVRCVFLTDMGRMMVDSLKLNYV